MREDPLDLLFDEAFASAARHSPGDYRPSWTRIRKRLERVQRTKAVRSAIIKLAAVAASMLIGGMLFGNTPVTKAFTPFYHYMKELPGGVVGVFFGTTQDTEKAKTNPPPDNAAPAPAESESGDVRMVAVTADEAKDKVAFALPTFAYVPAGYHLGQTEVFVRGKEEPSRQILYTFVDDHQKVFTLMMQQMKGDFAIGSEADPSFSTIEKVRLKNFGDGYLLHTEDGTTRLEFFKSNVYMVIAGILPKDDVLRFTDKMDFRPYE